MIAFRATDLDFLLRTHGINTVLITGVNTNCCVLATACAANVRDYAVIVVEDCVDTMDGPDHHEAALLCIRTAFAHVMNTEEVLSALTGWRLRRWEPQMNSPMIPSQRQAYSAIVDRPPLKLPDGARIIVWTIVNLEVWDISRPMARQVLPAPDRAGRCCPTCRTGAGTNTACGSACGGSSTSTKISASRRPSRSTRASARLSARRAEAARQRAGSSWATPMSRGRSTRSSDQTGMIDRSIDMHREIHRQAAGRLARARPDPDLRDARSPRRGRASNISATGSMTTSRPRSPPRTARSSRCPIRSS